jgi:hypothetical protein
MEMQMQMQMIAYVMVGFGCTSLLAVPELHAAKLKIICRDSTENFPPKSWHASLRSLDAAARC